MTSLPNGFPPELLQTLGWTLLHFIWQGTVLAALFAGFMMVFQSAAARYTLGVGALALMMASPVITFTSVHRQIHSAVRHRARGTPALTGAPAHTLMAHGHTLVPAFEIQAEQSTAMLWFVEAWCLGVLILSMRTAGGVLLIERMRRRAIQPLGQELYQKCLALQRKMGLDRFIRYCTCRKLDAPSVLGWLRPVVLLPVTALTGLTEEQIEAVIAHELAHIRRLDCFVNLFQIVAETLLFYHPAVWWVSQRIRVERENCCDDEAIIVCGSPVNYARALALMEEWRTAPTLMMAANRSPLAERVVRLVGLSGVSGRTRVAGLGASLVCLAGALLAGNALLGVAHVALGARASPKQEQSKDSVIVVRPENSVVKDRSAQATKPSGAAAQAAPKAQTSKDKDQQTAGEGNNKKESYLDAMEAAGFKSLTVDEIIAMKVQGVTPAYVKAIHELGLQPTADEIVGMRVQGITPDYIREMRTVEASLSIDQLIGMKVQGVTPQYARDMRELGLQPGPDELIGMKVQGVTPEYIREIRATGVKPDSDELVGMKVQGITTEYVEALQAAGFKDLTSDEIIEAKVQGITPEFIEKARKHGFQNLTLDKLMALKHADIF
jgi:beta-lactamase regulating signal transducer with metallopeptidase domain